MVWVRFVVAWMLLQPLAVLQVDKNDIGNYSIVFLRITCRGESLQRKVIVNNVIFLLFLFSKYYDKQKDVKKYLPITML